MAAAKALAELTKKQKAVAAAMEKALDAAEKYAAKTSEALEDRVAAAWDAHLTDLEAAEKAHLALSSALEGGIGDPGLDRLEKTHTENVMAAEEATRGATKATVDWDQALANVANQLIALGGAGEILGQLAGGIAGIRAGLSTFKAGKEQGGIGGLLGQVAGGLQIAGAAFGIGKAIFGLFKSDPVEDAQKKAGQTLGMTISKEMAEGFLREAENTGKTIADVAQQWFDDVKKKLREEGIAQAIGGVQMQADALAGAPQFAEIAARNFNTVFWETVKTRGLPAALEAFGDIYSKLREAFGDELPPGFERLETLFTAIDNPAVAAALQFAQGQAAVVGGATSGGFFDPSMTQDSVIVARATLAQLEGQGVDDKTANQLIAGLLQAEVNASIASGNAISADLQALLDEAEANGVQILPDIAHAQLDVLRKIFGAVSGNRGLPPGAPVIPGRPGSGDVGGGSPSFNDRGFAEGGIVTNPTRAIIGEAGPEAVIPLTRLIAGFARIEAAVDRQSQILPKAIRDAVLKGQAG